MGTHSLLKCHCAHPGNSCTQHMQASPAINKLWIQLPLHSVCTCCHVHRFHIIRLVSANRTLCLKGFVREVCQQPRFNYERLHIQCGKHG